MQIYLPIAEMSVPGEAILAVGALVGMFAGLFGIGGGFLTTPFLIFMGIPPAIAVGTQSNQLVAVSSGGILSHWRRGDVDVKMAGVMIAGSVVGTIIGVFLFKLLQHVGQIDVFVPILYVLLLGGVASLMLFESVATLFKKEKSDRDIELLYMHPFFMRLPYKMRFPRSRVYVSALVPGGIGFISGLMLSTLGIGGGFMIVPAMIYLLGMPTLLVAGTSLFQILFTSAFAALMHAITNQTVDLVLAALLIVGGVIGAQIGIALAKKIHGVYARLLLAVILSIVALQLAGGLLIMPSELYTTEVR